MDLETLAGERYITLDTKAEPVVFDGNKGHAVEDFSGERFSVILFTCPKRKQTNRENFRKLGIHMPTDDALERLCTFILIEGVSSASSSGGIIDISGNVAPRAKLARSSKRKCAKGQSRSSKLKLIKKEVMGQTYANAYKGG